MINNKQRSEWLTEVGQLKKRLSVLENLLAQDKEPDAHLPKTPTTDYFNHNAIPIDDGFKQINEFIFHKDRSGKYLYANQTYCKYLNTTPEEIVGKTDFDFVPNDVAQKYSLEDQRILSGDDPSSVNTEKFPFEGQMLLLSYRKVPIFDGNGIIIGLFCLGFEISELLQVKEELKRERRLIRTLIDIIPDQIFARDRDCRFILNNISDAKMMGVSDPQLLEGMSDEDFYPPELAARYQEDDFQVMNSGQPLINREEPLLSADGQQHWLLTTKVPLFDEQGKVIGVAGISRDITERRLAEKKLIEAMEENRASRDFLQNILDTSPSYISWKDRDLCYLGCNQATAKLIGLDDPEQIIGKTDKDLHHSAEQIEFDAQANQRIMDSGQPEYHILENGRDARGNLVWFDANRIPLRNITGDVIGILIFKEDITIQKTVQEQLQQLNTELESFSYSVSHDLRNPLRHINSYTQIILDEYADRLDAKGEEYFSRIRTASQQMDQLIENILRLSRITRSSLQLSHIDLCTIVREIVTNLRNDHPDRDVEMVLPEKLIVHADEPLMIIAIDNLIGNAWKYTGKTLHARIELGSFEQDNKKVIFIRDNGVGFEMSNVDKLFIPFQRLHTEKEFAGTGIGLAMVKRIVHRHGGIIWAEGDVGQGAAFYFTLE